MGVDTYLNLGGIEFDRAIPIEVVDKINSKIPRWDYTHKVKQNRDWPWTVIADGIVPDEGDARPAYGWDKNGKDKDDEGTSLKKIIKWLLKEIPDLKINGNVQVEWSSCESEPMLLSVDDNTVFRSYGHIEFGEEEKV
jgi:hypothetical protein